MILFTFFLYKLILYMYKKSEQYYEMKYYKYKAKIQKLKGGSYQEIISNLSRDDFIALTSRDIYQETTKNLSNEKIRALARQEIEEFIKTLDELESINPRLLFDYLTKTIRYKHNDMARILIDKGLELRFNILEHEPFVHVLILLACQKNNLEGLELIFEYNENADVNCQDPYGITPLMIACEYNYTDIVKILLERGANVAYEHRTGTPLSIVFKKYFNMEIFRLLVQYSTSESINIKYQNNKTILHIVLNNHQSLDLYDENIEEILKLLLDKGAIESFNEQDIFGKTIIYLACDYDLFNVVRFLLDYETKYRLEHSSSCAREPNNIVNISHEENTPLYIACRNGNIELVTYLLEYGADVNIGNNDSDDNAVNAHYISRQRYKSIHRNGPDDKIKDYNGRTPLFIAYIKNDIQLVELLLRYGATPEIPQLSEREINDKEEIFKSLSYADHMRIYRVAYVEPEIRMNRDAIDGIISEYADQKDRNKKGAKSK